VLTQTNPFPPPGAGVAFVVVPAAPLFEGAAAAAGLADAEVRGLKKSARLGFAALAVGVAEGAAASFLRVCFFFGEASGDSAVEGDAGLSVGELVACAFLCVRCFAGEGDSAGDPAGVGDWACKTQTVIMVIAEMKEKNLVVINASVENL
jgi:hypothetical protein